MLFTRWKITTSSLENINYYQRCTDCYVNVADYQQEGEGQLQVYAEILSPRCFLPRQGGRCPQTGLCTTHSGGQVSWTRSILLSCLS